MGILTLCSQHESTDSMKHLKNTDLVISDKNQ